MPDMPIGQLVKLYRIDRRKSTVNLATLAGITARYLEMIEAGAKTPSLPVLRKLAKVLGVRTSALLGEPPSEDNEGPINPQIARLERALFTYDSLPLEVAVSRNNLEERIEAALDAWYTSSNGYSYVLAELPNIIVETEHLVRESGRSREACLTAYKAHRLARAVAKYTGRMDLCILLADRIMRYAEESENPVTLAAASWTLGQTLLTNDMPNGALDVAMMAIESLEPSLADAGTEQISVYGGLVQCASIATTRVGDPWRGRELLVDKAAPAAERTGDHQDSNRIFFGPTNVRMHAVSIEMEAGDPSEAIRRANDVEISNIASVERQCSHLYQVAKAYECKNNDTAVFIHLKMAERLRPEDFQHKRQVRTMVSTLLKRAKPSYAGEVRQFANNIGLLN